MKDISAVQNWLLISIVLAASGMLYSMLVFPENTPLTGAVFALLMCLPIFAFERQILFRGLHRRIRMLPTAIFLLAALAIYELLMRAGFAVAVVLMSSIGAVEISSWRDVFHIPFDSVVYMAAVCALIIFILRVRELLGAEVFSSMLIGRYRNPVREERVFLILDLADSTHFAEEHGDLRTQQFLKALFATFAEPVRRHKGAIDDYIGDAAIITWPLARGVEDARCVRCVFDILGTIEANAETWIKTFGQVPRLRAALHGGHIITGEIGVDHHKIAYFGDTVNTTARLEGLSKTLNRPVLISADLLHHMTMPDAIDVEDLGMHAVKGRGQALGVMALAERSKVRKMKKRQMPAITWITGA